MKNWIVWAVLALVIAAGSLLYYWKGMQSHCSSPITIVRLKDEMSFFNGDKSGAKRVEVVENGDLILYQYFLEPGKKTRNSYDPKYPLIVSITKGEGVLHSARFGEKGELIWFSDLPIKEGDYFAIPPKITYQFEAPLNYETSKPVPGVIVPPSGSEDHSIAPKVEGPKNPALKEDPLFLKGSGGIEMLIYSLKSSQQRGREFLREEHASSYPCKRVDSLPNPFDRRMNPNAPIPSPPLDNEVPSTPHLSSKELLQMFEGEPAIH